jgi:hypothetical protein
MRNRIETQIIYMRGPQQLAELINRAVKIPLDDENPVEVVIREQLKKRKLTRNQSYWAGTLADIERDAEHLGRKFPAKAWHQAMKLDFLPDENAPGFDPAWVVEGYHKWSEIPGREEPVLIGSTTQLTDAGMRRYVLAVESHMSQEYKVTFTTKLEPPRGKK